ncbi:hypothetical protein Cri9333_1597 [Crinalium epipsammum PCC 9333]|uniref:DUF4440 domain-containing protein n=1 Tax=Crinalium epipsammum PCC 9333 TaxID=1173022 RepID=K9VY95_9CYAN|nr:nuclear transport factor 2 family protein [Crinalium epipsammum]AFZ12487.1 hypothetical protein Cri9333_1597 [Crinalium epipsammum PCC 9333]
MEDLRNYIKKIQENLMRVVQEKNADLLSDLVTTYYSENSLIMPANHAWVQGLEAIKSFWADLLNPDFKELRCETLDLQLQDDTAYEIGKATSIFLEEGQLITDIATYLIVWKRHDGVWKVNVDIWNDSIPPSGQ